jgi:hypothetical protein
VNRMVARVVGLLPGQLCLLMSCPTTPETNAKHARWLRNEFRSAGSGDFTNPTFEPNAHLISAIQGTMIS